MGYGLPNYGFFKWIRLHMLPALADTWAPKEKAKKPVSTVCLQCAFLEASQRSLHNAPIFRLLLKVAVNGTHQCDFYNF